MAEQAHDLRVELLGPVLVRRDGDELRLGAPRQRALFAVLASRADKVVSREDLINAIWGHEAPTSADGSIYTYVSGLRRALEPGRGNRAVSALLLSEGPGYRLRVDADAVDLHEFDALRRRAEQALEDGDQAAAVEAADRALALWHGEPLSGLPGPWAASLRDRLLTNRLDLLETRAAAGLAGGRHAELVAELTALVRENPLHEGLRGLLMIALYRVGRQADAVEQFRAASRVLADELATQPGARLAEIHQQILTNDPVLTAPAVASPPRVRRRPAWWASRPRPRARAFVARDHELSVLREAVRTVAGGKGGVLLVEGEPGIGKSELLTTGMAACEDAAVQLVWGAGDELASRFPLRLMLDCLGIDADSPDPARARVAEMMRLAQSSRDPLGGGDPTLAVVNELVAIVREMCADGPLALVADDIQWADEASLLVFSRLALETATVPLLLIGALRPVPRTPVLDGVRDVVSKQGGSVLQLAPLAGGEVAELLRGIVGGAPGAGLLGLADRAAGNPLYVGELAEALLRDRHVEVSAGQAEVAAGGVSVPTSLSSALTHRLGFLTAATTEVLRRAALLGTEFAIADLAVLMGRPAGELLPALEEATTAKVLLANGDRYGFRHALIRQALYDATSPTVRTVLHRQAAERLDRAGASMETVARQLVAAPVAVDSWVIDWMLRHGERIAHRAPDIGLDLLRRVVASCDADDPRHVELTAVLARVLYWRGELPEDEVRSVLALTRDPDLAGEMQWIRAVVHYRRGQEARSVAALREAVSAPEVSAVWQARCQALLAVREGMGLLEFDLAKVTAAAAIDRGEKAGDGFAVAFALQALWLFQSIARDHAAALRHVDEALAVVAEDAGLAHLHLSLLDNRVFSLQNLDRLDEADQALAAVRSLVHRYQLPGGLPMSTAVNHYWAGRWGDALVELSIITRSGPELAFLGLRESSPMLLLSHGVAALIAALRDDGDDVAAHLAAADELPMLTTADRENCDFLLMAEAQAADRDGRVDQALIALEPVLDPRYAPMMLRHQWLPDVVRLALQAGSPDVVARALEICSGEASREVVPARAAAALLRCRGLAEGDPAQVMKAVSHYRAVGRPVELAQALEDLAVVLAQAGRRPEGEAALSEAVRRYEAVGAAWPARRATARFAGREPGKAERRNVG
ncbi:BTAD domain-containing putative transcriptional regulator [Kutzneria kofuensis]|uniref:DNA-binding SARP family transcriptional activator n=1 Tax=Kutzneria kofuensis TaxID=103725 RepID=A0A7W9KB80_9PSEU|nr:BTAD domain-containing putative transcriptional regulator [Kutzneria kofuensis]MBB5889394.1 DNA-binding SARP family transcriptional activator [Kutzneria kofuensis]